FIEHCTEAENIGACIELLAFGLLRRHISCRARYPLVMLVRALLREQLGGILVGSGLRLRKLRETEIENLWNTILGNHDVRRLQIAMEDAGGVGASQGVRGRNRIFQRRRDG